MTWLKQVNKGLQWCVIFLMSELDCIDSVLDPIVADVDPIDLHITCVEFHSESKSDHSEFKLQVRYLFGYGFWQFLQPFAPRFDSFDADIAYIASDIECTMLCIDQVTLWASFGPDRLRKGREYSIRHSFNILTSKLDSVDPDTS